MPVVDKTTFQSTNPKVFFGGDAAFGPENVITAVAHGHQAAVSIHAASVPMRPILTATASAAKMTRLPRS
jgi:NADPH-dependent glutamate synthase beta subunit-like oxidoreductase